MSKSGWVSMRVFALVGLAGCAQEGRPSSGQNLADMPTLQYEPAEGFGNIFLYASAATQREFVVVFASRARLGLATGDRTFDLSLPNEALQVHVDMYSQPPGDPYATDVDPAPGSELLTSTWNATSGKIRITLFPPLLDADGTPTERYRARVVLEDCVFDDRNGRLVRQAGPIELEAEVGWLLG